MGWKAEVKKLKQMLEMKEKQIDILFAAMKVLVTEKGETDEGCWLVRVPEFNVDEINVRYSMASEPTDGGNLVIRVEERKDSKEEE